MEYDKAGAILASVFFVGMIMIKPEHKTVCVHNRETIYSGKILTKERLEDGEFEEDGNYTDDADFWGVVPSESGRLNDRI